MSLTHGQRKIMDFVAQGMGNKNIAHELKLSEHTVKAHVHTILKKLGVHNRVGATLKYREMLQEPELEYRIAELEVKVERLEVELQAANNMIDQLNDEIRRIKQR